MSQIQIVKYTGSDTFCDDCKSNNLDRRADWIILGESENGLYLCTEHKEQFIYEYPKPDEICRV